MGAGRVLKSTGAFLRGKGRSRWVEEGEGGGVSPTGLSGPVRGK